MPSILQRTIESLIACGCKSMIANDPGIDRPESLSKTDYCRIDDARSAAFYAFGQAKTAQNPTLLVLEERYLSHTYTALTEAWLQRIPLRIVAYASVGYPSTGYLERCVDRIFCLKESDDPQSVVQEAMACPGPVLIKIDGCASGIQEYDYGDIVAMIADRQPDATIFCYRASGAATFPCEVRRIGPDHKYGAVSKYLGFLTACKGLCVLCIGEELLALDANAFNYRDMPRNLKIIVKGDESGVWERTNEWIASNGITCLTDNGLTSGECIDELLDAKVPCVYYKK